MKNKQALVIGAVVLVAGGVGFWLYRRWKLKQYEKDFPKPPKVPKPNLDNGGGSSGGSSSSWVSDSSFPLVEGMMGDKVKNVQSYLNSTTGDYGLAVDGFWGELTQEALESWNGKTEVSQGYYKWILEQPSSVY
jgi:hypothetical protein